MENINKTPLISLSLTVSRLDRSLDFYQNILGFSLHQRENDTASLGSPRRAFLHLAEIPDAPRPSGTTGLYHFAVLLPSRRGLGQTLRHLVETKIPLQGFADHGVSEAIYLPDPDGNGIEIYRDRPRADWPREQDQLRMVTDPLDTEALLSLAAGSETPWQGLPPETRLGHVHLHVNDLSAAERFYREILGFDLIQRYGKSASFLSKGGYHHHIGINTWAGVDAPPPPQGAIGLRWFRIHLPDESVIERLHAAELPIKKRGENIFTRDPAGNGILIQP